jgi:hypothetical protein
VSLTAPKSKDGISDKEHHFMKTKRPHSYWDIWLRTTKQRLAAFTICLMLALGIIAGGEAHTHVENNSPTPTTIVQISNTASGSMMFRSNSGPRST